jgi:hypothetical protein
MLEELEGMLEIVEPQPPGKPRTLSRRRFDLPEGGAIEKETREAGKWSASVGGGMLGQFGICAMRTIEFEFVLLPNRGPPYPVEMFDSWTFCAVVFVDQNVVLCNKLACAAFC